MNREKPQKNNGANSRWIQYLGFPGGTSGKETTCQCRRHKDVSTIPGLKADSLPTEL